MATSGQQPDTEQSYSQTQSAGKTEFKPSEYTVLETPNSEEELFKPLDILVALRESYEATDHSIPRNLEATIGAFSDDIIRTEGRGQTGTQAIEEIERFLENCLVENGYAEDVEEESVYPEPETKLGETTFYRFTEDIAQNFEAIHFYLSFEYG